MYAFSRFILLIITKLLFFFKVEGRENIPAEGRAVLCANHKSFWDPVMVGVSIKRQPGYIAKEELFRFKPFGAYLKSIGVFPLKRGRGDFGAVKTAVSILKNDKMLMIFPEGTRVRKGKKVAPKPGFIRIAKMTDSVIIPIGISGDFTPFKRVTVKIGKPITVLEGIDKPENEEVKNEAEKIMNEIYTLAGENGI